MNLIKTEKDELTEDDILKFIDDYEKNVVPTFNNLNNYFKARNSTIVNRKKPDASSTDNKIIVAYGRKIVNSFAGYAYRPNYITYKADIERDESLLEGEEKVQLPEEVYMEQLQKIFNKNKEHIKTAKAGKMFAVYGVYYEIVYIDRETEYKNGQLINNAIPKFFGVDPREMILIYDYESEPNKKFGIRFYKTEKETYRVEVYSADKIDVYIRTKDVDYTWKLKLEETYPNYFNAIPIVAYYFDDDMTSIMDPVLSLIDANDVLYSDSMNEFTGFASAYLVMTKFGLTDPTKMKTPGMFSEVLANLKRKRVIENLPADASIKYLLKDIPTEFITFMSEKIREQIHIQSHVPDFTSEKMSGASGIAIKRLLFDFENLVSSADANFDLGLNERIELITIIMKKAKMGINEDMDMDVITINHKRNLPLDLGEYATTAVSLKSAGFSSYLVADTMPDDVVPDIQAELARQKQEAEELMGNDIESGYTDFGGDDPNNVDEQEIVEEEGV